MTIYSDALNARIAVAIADSASTTNIKKLRNMRDMCSKVKFAELLIASNVDADRFTRAIYASEKVIKFAHCAVESSTSDVNENAFAAFKTAMQLHAAKLTFTKRDAEASISRDVKATDEHAAHVYQRHAVLSHDTLNAQSQQVIDMLKTLNILHNASAKDYHIVRNDIADALCKKFQICGTV